MRILVTGGTGFIGGALVKRLIQDGHDVMATGTSPGRLPEGAHFLPVNLNGIDWDALEGVQTIFHQAAINDTTYKDRRQMLLANLGASTVLLNKAEDVGCKNFVFASTTAIYGNEPAPFIEGVTLERPGTFYAESKKFFETRCLHYSKFKDRPRSMNIVCLRYCNVYGPGEGHKGKRMSVVGQIGRNMLKNERPQLFSDGSHSRDWVYIDDVVEANVLAMKHKGFGAYNCGSGVSTSFNNVVKIWNRHLGSNIKPEYIDNPYQEWYQRYTECDMNKAKEGLGFVPQCSIEEGIGMYLGHLESEENCG